MKFSLSIIMTVHNGEPYLREAVASLLGQTYHDFELVVVDNGSTDDSIGVLHSFGDPRLRIIELGRNLERVPALNIALDAARGSYIAVQDADDVSMPTRLELQVAFLKDHPKVVLVGTGVRLIDGQGKVLRDRGITVGDTDIRWLHYIGQGAFAHSSMMYSSAAAKEAGGYARQYAYTHDYVLCSRLLSMGQGANMPQRLVYLRKHSSNMYAPALAEPEVRAILQQHLRRLFPEQADATLENVAKALRYDPSVAPTQDITDCLLGLPRRFAADHGRRPSQGLMREYGRRWLQMARVSKQMHLRGTLAWVKLAIWAQPSLMMGAEVLFTFASMGLAAFDRRRGRVSLT